MSELLLYERELEEICEKIHQLELTENKENNSWSFWFKRNDHTFIRKTCLERKAVWNNLKVNIERKTKLIERIQNQTLLFRFSTQLSKAEEKIAKLEARLNDLKTIEESKKIGNYVGYAILIILLIFVLYMLATGKWKLKN